MAKALYSRDDIITAGEQLNPADDNLDEPSSNCRYKTDRRGERPSSRPVN